MKKIVVIFLLLLTPGCDILTTRTADKPEQPRGNYVVATTSELLIQNLINSFSEKNTQNYLNCLTDSAFSGKSFQFIPSAESVSQFPILLQSWDKQDEEQYLRNLFAKMPEDQPITLSFSETTINLQGDSVFYSAKYFISAPHSEIKNPKIFQGEIRLKLFRDSRLIWTIYNWQDIKNSTVNSWSELKGYFY